jgi:hypothetical protein
VLTPLAKLERHYAMGKTPTFDPRLPYLELILWERYRDQLGIANMDLISETMSEFQKLNSHADISHLVAGEI